MAASSIARLSVSLDLNSARFSQKLKKASKESDGFSKKFKVSLLSIGSGALKASAAIAGVSAAVLVMTNRVADAFDPIGKFADSIGISAEALQELHYAAGQSGVSTQQLDSALSKMTRRIEFYARGGGAAAQALRDLGFEQDQLAKLDTEEQFYEVANAINSIESESRRAALAFEIFGDSGRAMTVLLNAGTDGINEMRQRAQDLGHILSREAIAGLEAYGDAADDASKTMSAFSNHMSASLAPALTVLNQMFSDSIIEMGGMGKVGEAVGEALTTMIGFVGDAVQNLIRLWRVLRVAVQSFYVKVLELADGLGVPFQKVGELIHTYLTLRIKAAMVALHKFADFIGLDIANAIQESIDKIDSYKPKDIVNSEYIAKQKQALEELKQVANESFAAGSFSESFKSQIDEMLQSISEAHEHTKDKNLGASLLGDENDIKRRGDAILAEINRYVSTADELRQQNYDRQISELDTLIEKDLGRRQEYIEMKKRLEAKYAEESAEIEAKQLEAQRQADEKRIEDGLNAADKIFGNNKSSSLRQAMLSMQTNIAKASELGFPQNVPAMASALAQGVGIVNTIKGIAHSGLNRVPSEGTYLLQKDEAVLKKQDAEAYRQGNLGEQAQNVTINPTVKVEGRDERSASQISDMVVNRIINDLKTNGRVAKTIRSYT